MVGVLVTTNRRRDGRWASLGTVATDAEGDGVLIADSDGGVPPVALEITVEQASGTNTPNGPVVVEWSRQ